MSTIANAKKSCGWVDPRNRAGCHNCLHEQRDPAPDPNRLPDVRCIKHGFFTRRFAICNDWTDSLGVGG